MSQNWTPPPAGGSATVPNYMVPAIISIFCCWPLAIPAIIFASQVNNKVAAGDFLGPQDFLKKGQKFVQIAVWLGIFLEICVDIFCGFVMCHDSLNSLGARW